uniref:Uncharacterized protein n=1 Tax=Stomoxys calcitrans TaxID=35570 RepID=A0A1I8NXJ2_STOCA
MLDRTRLIYSNNKPHHHHHVPRDKLGNCSGSATGGGVAGVLSSAPSLEADEQSNESVAETCDSHQQQQQQLKNYKHQQQLQKSHNQSQPQQHQLHYQPLYHNGQQQTSICSVNTTTSATSVANDYYDHLKRLDKLALGLVAEQLHPWHNDKSDLESLNSDYFKNSLHQSHELKQQHYEIGSLEQTDNLLGHEKPRIYQSRRQKQQAVDANQKQTNSTGTSGADSCPENSQSSVFPETTTSNSDDQSDSGSLSEQEYDITKIEEIYQKTHIEGDADSYEIISLTTTTRTRFESTGDEGENHSNYLDECDCSQQKNLNFDEYPEDSNQHTTTDTEVEGTLKRSRAVSDNLQKIIAYDSVYLSSEESSDSTLVETDGCETSLEVTSLHNCVGEAETILHISIEDAIYEPKAKQNKIDHPSLERRHEPIGFVETVNTKIEILEEDSCEELHEEGNSPIYTQVLKIEHTPSAVIPQSVTSTTSAVGVTSSVASKPKILSVVEKRKLKRYSDSAYSSNLSDSSERTHGSYPSNESSAFAHHLKRQVAEPLYFPLKSNLSENQYHSLPDVNIGQILKVSESIDAHLRSSYNSDHYHSLEETIGGNECSVEENPEATTAPDSHSTLEKKQYKIRINQKNLHEVVTPEQIYDSIKRFGRAHQRYRQKEKESQQQKQHQQELYSQQQLDLENPQTKERVKEEPKKSTKDSPEDKEIQSVSQVNEVEISEGNQLPTAEDSQLLESTQQSRQCTVERPPEDVTSTDNEQYDSFEKPKEAPAITIENFSQQIERRAKEIRLSGRRSKQLQIEFANRAKFRLENTLATLSESEEPKVLTKIDPATTAASNFRIVVTDAQNNIIEEDSIENRQGPATRIQHNENEKENHNSVNLQEGFNQQYNDSQIARVTKDRVKGSATPVNSGHRQQGSLKRAPSKPKRQQFPANLIRSNLSSEDTKNQHPISPKTKERRVLTNQIYRARPVKVITATDSFRRNKTKQTSNKMSRPQILQVIDNKRKSPANVTASSGTTTGNLGEANQAENEYLKKVDAVRCYWSKLVSKDVVVADQPPTHQFGEELDTPITAKKEKQLQLQPEATKQSNDDGIRNTSPTNHIPEKRHFVLGAQENGDVTTHRPPAAAAAVAETVPADAKTQPQSSAEDFGSFMPSIEIVELDGDKKATIVSAVPSNATADNVLNAKEPQFDHIRYKVMKSQQLLRSNLLARNTKEAQFDGLIQYLQEYSFQELLSNNNVVIVEPVRTKIERPMASSCFGVQQHANKGANAVKVDTGLGKGEAQISNEVSFVDNGSRKQRNNSTTSSNGSGGIKRHFFYQPVRVNRELYEEELPNPDTVRNVRKFFEEHILPTPGRGLLTTAVLSTTTATGMGTATITTTTTTATLTKATHKNNGNGITVAKETSPKSKRTRKYRYLTIDTSYGHAAHTPNSKQLVQNHRQQQQLQNEKNRNSQTSRKWDTASLSSGVSSGDLSSPCESNETEAVSKRSDDSHSGRANTGENKVSQDGSPYHGVHVQDIVNQHNNISVKKSRSAAGIPVRSSSVRTRSTIQGAAAYATLHRKSGKTNVYRSIYELHAIQRQRDSDDQGAAFDCDDGDDDEGDLFGNADDGDNELCDTYYVSNDVLRKIRECGSSVTYYGGRVVQTSNNAIAGGLTKTLNPSYNKHNALVTMGSNNNVFTTTTMTPHNPTMLSQTQTRARVREIETCSSSSALCQPANECSSHKNGQNDRNRLLQPEKPQLTKCDNQENKNKVPTTTAQPQGISNNGWTKSQGCQDANCAASGKSQTSNNSFAEGGGVTFKLVKSNSCSSRLELAGADADAELEDREVVRKMVHHFEASTATKHQAAAEVSLTINNQTPISSDSRRFVTENQSNRQQERTLIPVTVNNHINVAEGILTHSTNDAPKPEEENKADIDSNVNSDNQQAGGKTQQDIASHAKVCRNKNVDLAFTLVKQQQPNTNNSKHSGSRESEMGTNHKVPSAIGLNGDTENTKVQRETHGIKNEAKAITNNDTHKMSAGILKADEESWVTPTFLTVSSQTPDQIIVPVEIHRPGCDSFSWAGNRQQADIYAKIGEEKYPLSTTSSVTSVIDKSVVKHYVANDRSIYEKRKYDDIEFEEFEVYDPTKDFERLIEDEEAKRAPSNSIKQDNQILLPSPGKSGGQEANGSAETETDCYDSLDDKL